MPHTSWSNLKFLNEVKDRQVKVINMFKKEKKKAIISWTLTCQPIPLTEVH